MITPEQLAASGSEDGHQSALFCWSALPDVRAKYPELEWLFAIPNGGWRDPITANKLKTTGVKKGVLDICLLVRRGEYAALWIELKRPKSKGKPKGRITDDQSIWLEHARFQGHGAALCVGWESARDMIIKYLEHGK